MAGMEGPLSQQKLRDKKRKKIPDYVSIRHISAWCVIFGTSGSFLVIENIPGTFFLLQDLRYYMLFKYSSKNFRKHSKVSGNLLECLENVQDV